MTLRDSIKKILDRQDLSAAESSAAMDSIMDGNASPAQIAALLTALRMKGETVDEVSGAAASMRRHAQFIDAGTRAVVDTCGTGGDGLDTFNISTTAAFITAGAGVCVAKHGNRAVSSKCGSADVLLELGVKIDADPSVMEQCIQDYGIGFLFAPCMHPAMKYAMPVRRELGYRTLFNMLGPLTNPAGATGQVLGVFDPQLTEMFAKVLAELGTRRAYVVNGADGLDEISTTDITRVSELRDGQVRTYSLSPEMIMGDSDDPAELSGGDIPTNAAILRNILEGKDGARRRIALLNAAAAIAAGEAAEDLREGLALAKKSIDSGAALGKLEILIRESNA